jgi:hypothetical protein
MPPSKGNKALDSMPIKTRNKAITKTPREFFFPLGFWREGVVFSVLRAVLLAIYVISILASC